MRADQEASGASRHRIGAQRVESLLLLCLAFQGAVLLLTDGQAGEWLLVSLMIFLAVWAYVGYPPGVWATLTRTAGALLFAMILSAADGGAISPFALGFVALATFYSLVLPWRYARLLPAITALLYLALGFSAGSSPVWSEIIGAATIIAGLGASVLWLRLLWESRRTLHEDLLLQNQRNNQLTALEHLTRGATHDLNNLLTAISGQIELARAGVNPHDPVHEYLESAHTATEQAISLSRRLRLSSGHVTLEMRTMGLNSFLEAQAAQWSAQLPANITLRRETSAGLPPIQANPDALVTLLRELFAISRANIGSGPGRIAVKIGSQSLPTADAGLARYTGQTLGPGEFVTLTIQDNGDRLSHEELDRLFEPYHSPRVRGLGPALILGIVRAHRGGILSASEPETGNMITCFFPAYLGNAAQAKAPVETTTAGHPSSLRLILLLSADIGLRDRLEEQLELSAVRVMVATTGERALALYDEFAAGVVLAVLDLDVTDPTVVAKLKARNPTLRIIVYGRGDPALRSGVQSLVFLPGSPELKELVAQVHAQLQMSAPDG